MSRPSSDEEGYINIEGSIPSDVTMPARLSFFGITYEQWGGLRRQVENIDLSENIWFLIASVCFTLSFSFGIGTTQLESAVFWIRGGFLAAAAASFVGAAAFGIFGWQTRGRRKGDIKEILEYMDDIKLVEPE